MGNTLDLVVSLNSVDLPEEFEDNMEKWSKLVAHTLSLPTGKLPEEMIEEVEFCQKKTLSYFNLYSSKYMEDFEPFVGEFFQSIWNRLVEGRQVSQALMTPFMMAVELLLRSPRFRDEFKNEASLNALFERLILPGIALTD